MEVSARQNAATTGLVVAAYLSDDFAAPMPGSSSCDKKIIAGVYQFSEVRAII
jgi:hypothetical protein